MFNSQRYLDARLKEMGISEEDFLTMGIAERNALMDSIESERQAELQDWEDQLGPDV